MLLSCCVCVQYWLSDCLTTILRCVTKVEEVNPTMAWPMSVVALLCVGVACLMPRPSAGHGYLYDPPSRSSTWRHPEWKNLVKINVRDNELNCGGLNNELTHGYKCGLCGDPYQENPRENEAGGKFASARWRPITANYTQGQEIVIKARLTAHHKGWMSIKLCPTNDFSVRATQECMDQHPVSLPDGKLSYDMTVKHAWYNVTFVLPDDLTCDLCVLQWRYHAGNNWGTDPDTGKSGTGLGPQEEFYGCADVSISPSAGANPTTPNPTTPRPTTPNPTTPRPTTPNPTTPRPTTTKPSTAKPTTSRPSTPQPTTATPTSAKSTTRSPTTVQPAGGSTEEPTPNVMSLCRDYDLGDGLHVDPTSCRHYLECDRLHTRRTQCPPGAGFSPRYKICDRDFIC